MQKQARIKNSMLKTNEFDSIFSNQEFDRRGKEREKKEIRTMQEQLYQNYVENPQLYRPAERDIDVSAGPHTIL
jgi:hypothetical protein